MKTLRTPLEPLVATGSYSVKTHRLEFESALLAGGTSSFLFLWILAMATRNGVNPLALGWLLALFLTPVAIIAIMGAFLTQSPVYHVGASGVSVTRRGKTIEHVPWDRVRWIQHGPVHTVRGGRKRRGQLLVVCSMEGPGVFLSSLRHGLPAHVVLDATKATLRYANAYGVNVAELEVLRRESWEPLRHLGG